MIEETGKDLLKKRREKGREIEVSSRPVEKGEAAAEGEVN